VLLLDNAEHASASSVPTSSPKLDLCRVAEGCGMQASEIVTDPEVVAGLRAAALDGRPHFLRVRIAGGNAPGIPWLHADPVVLAERFRTWLGPDHGGTAEA
jgi:thiamine pyrophosphate-dependent acetolactate synthase large subunit-like protein